MRIRRLLQSLKGNRDISSLVEQIVTRMSRGRLFYVVLWNRRLGVLDAAECPAIQVEIKD